MKIFLLTLLFFILSPKNSYPGEETREVFVEYRDSVDFMRKSINNSSGIRINKAINKKNIKQPRVMAKTYKTSIHDKTGCDSLKCNYLLYYTNK